VKKKNKEPNTKQTKAELERSVLGSAPEEKILHNLFAYYISVIYQHVKKTCAILNQPDETRHIFTTAYQNENDEFSSDVFIVLWDLHEFSLNPYLYIFQDTTIAELNMFGIDNELDLDVLPNAVLLTNLNVKKYFYYGWDEITDKYGKWDITGKVNTLANKLKNPAAYDEYKNQLLAKREGVLTIQDLACLQMIKTDNQGG
jgi:hypothetical protein